MHLEAARVSLKAEVPIRITGHIVSSGSALTSASLWVDHVRGENRQSGEPPYNSRLMFAAVRRLFNLEVVDVVEQLGSQEAWSDHSLVLQGNAQGASNAR